MFSRVVSVIGYLDNVDSGDHLGQGSRAVSRPVACMHVLVACFACTAPVAQACGGVLTEKLTQQHQPRSFRSAL